MKEYLSLLPLLLLYTSIILIFSDPVIDNDQGRYVRYAQNIVNGYYTNSENPYLASGPGYPIYLSLFVGLKLPLIVPKLFNGLLIFIGILYFYNLMKKISNKKKALLASYVLGLYFPMFAWIIVNITEPLMFIMVCMFMYYSYSLTSTPKFNYTSFLIASFSLGALILTKFIFLYVVIICILIFAFYTVFYRDTKSIKFILILASGFILTIPYLAYTHSITGRVFYTSTASGLGLYWMSSKNAGEVGSCLSSTHHTLWDVPGINEKHKLLFDSLKHYTYIEKNDILLNIAKKNIINNPLNYAENVVNNVSRLLFNFPFSYRYQSLKTHWYMLYNIILIISFFSSLYVAWIKKSSIPSELLFLGTFFLCYFAGSSLVIALSRMFFPIVPFIICWITYTYSKYIKIVFT